MLQSVITSLIPTHHHLLFPPSLHPKRVSLSSERENSPTTARTGELRNGGNVKESTSFHQCGMFSPLSTPTTCKDLAPPLFLGINLHPHHPPTFSPTFPTNSTRCIRYFNSPSPSTNGIYSRNARQLCAVIIAKLDPCVVRTDR